MKIASAPIPSLLQAEAAVAASPPDLSDKSSLMCLASVLFCSLRVIFSGFNIIVVDGTWTQAKKVARSLPDSIPYVRLMSTGQLAFKAPMRTQTEPDRICTLGAIIQLFSVRMQP